MSYPYDTFYPPSYGADPIGYASFDTNQNHFTPNQVENAPSYPDGSSSAPEPQPSGGTWPVPAQYPWVDELGGAFFEDQSYNALLESMVATGLPHGLEHASLSDLQYSIPKELAQPSEVHQVQDYSLLACPQGAPSSAYQTGWQPNTYTFSDAISPTSLVVPSISVDQPPPEGPAGYLQNSPQYSSAVPIQPTVRGAAALSGSSTPWGYQGLCERQAPGADLQIGELSTSSSRLVPSGTGASRTKRKEHSRSHVSYLPSPDIPSNLTRHTTTRAGLSPYHRANIYERPAFSRRAKSSQRGVQASRSSSNASSPLSFVSVSPLPSHAGSPMSITSVESNGSPYASDSALPSGHSGSTQTQPAAQVSVPPRPDRAAVAKLLTRFFEQPDAVAHRPKYEKADLLCQWVSPIGMVCSNRKWEVPGESLKDLTGRKAIGFCSGDRATVLRHMALHREEEMLQIRFGCVPEDRRTVWDNLAINTQLRLDSAKSREERC